MILAVLAPALAFQTLGDCNGNVKKFDIGSWGDIEYKIDANFSSSQLSQIDQAVTAWNIPQSEMHTSTANYAFPSEHVRKNDGKNSIVLVDGICQWYSDGVDYWIRGDSCVSFNPGEFREVDIGLYSCMNWAAPLDYYDFIGDVPAGDDRDLPQHVVRLTGFTLGLVAEPGSFSGTAYDGWPVTMSTWSLDGGSAISESGPLTGRQYLVGEDDREGLRELYPDTTEEGEDLAVQSYTLPDAAAEIGSCDAGVARPSPYIDMSGSDPGLSYDVCREYFPTLSPAFHTFFQGSPFDVEFTLHNLGSNTQSSVSVVISLAPESASNPTLVVLEDTVTLNPNRPYEVEYEVWIPSDAEPDRYSVQFQIDPENVVDELDEFDNNVAYWNRYVDVEALPACSGCATAPPGAPLSLALTTLAFVRRRRCLPSS